MAHKWQTIETFPSNWKSVTSYKQQTEFLISFTLCMQQGVCTLNLLIILFLVSMLCSVLFYFIFLPLFLLLLRRLMMEFFVGIVVGLHLTNEFKYWMQKLNFDITSTRHILHVPGMFFFHQNFNANMNSKQNIFQNITISVRLLGTLLTWDTIFHLMLNCTKQFSWIWNRWPERKFSIYNIFAVLCEATFLILRNCLKDFIAMNGPLSF